MLLFVLDTLREDHSLALSQLEEKGFVRYQNVIAPSPWTVPSHISLFTGLLPSEHGVHERVGAKHFDLSGQSKEAMSVSSNLISLMKHEGYKTYGFSGNPAISPKFGFQFDDYRLYGNNTRVEEAIRLLSENKTPPNAKKLEKASLLLRKGGLGLASYMFYYREFKTRILGQHPLDKGSKSILADLSRMRFNEPFFLFVNLMESHDPYFYNEGEYFRQNQFAYISGSRYGSKNFNVCTRYPKHAKLSISRLMQMINVLEPVLERSLVIVTSDHGQLLGEGGKYWHGYFLDDELLRVPLYVRYPNSCKPMTPDDFINLTEIPKIVRYVTSSASNDSILGSKTAFAESFGVLSDCSEFAENDEQLQKFLKSYSWRIRLFTTKGSAVYNKSIDSFEEIQGSLSEKEARELIEQHERRLATGESKHTEKKVDTASRFTKSEEEDLRVRLGALGYL